MGWSSKVTLVLKLISPRQAYDFPSGCYCARLMGFWAQTHYQSQNLKCVGCGDEFARAAGLMRHIEQDECKFITQEVFERRRAEKSIVKDAWAAQLKPELPQHFLRGTISTFSDGDSAGQGGVSLLDADNPLESSIHSSSQRDYLTPSLNMLSLRDQDPTAMDLKSQEQKKATDQDGGSNLMSFGGSHITVGKEPAKPAWNALTPAAAALFPNSKSPVRPTEQYTAVAGGMSSSKSNFPTDPNSHLNTGPAPIVPPPLLDPMNHFNSMTKKFECPGSKCGGSFDTFEAFNEHLSSSVHSGGPTVCPSCLNRFSSTMALVAHCESPSKRCNIRNSANYNQVLREITGGLIGAEGHHIDGSVRYVANDIRKPGFW